MLFHCWNELIECYFFSNTSNFDMFYHHFCKCLFILNPLSFLSSTHTEYFTNIFATHFLAKKKLNKFIIVFFLKTKLVFCTAKMEGGGVWKGCKKKKDTYHYINISNSLLVKFFFFLEHQSICFWGRGNPDSVIEVFRDWQDLEVLQRLG